MSLHSKITQTAILTFALWFVRLFHENMTFENNTAEHVWLWILKPVVLAVLGVVYIFTHLRSFKDATRIQCIIFTYTASALFCIPYVPDMFASFNKAGEPNALLLSIAFYLLGIITYGTIRGGTFFVSHKFLHTKVKSSLFQSIVIYPVLLTVEFCFFHSWHPITYFPSMPLPLPAARLETKSDEKNVKYLLIESYIDGKMRQDIKSGSALSLNILGKKIAAQIEQQSTATVFGQTLHVLLPETFVAIEDPTDILSLVAPVADTVFRFEGVDKLIWIQGAFLNNSNVILGTELQRPEQTNSPSTETLHAVTLLRKKADQMPMFEVASKGISYSNEEHAFPTMNSIVPDEQSALKDFAQTHQLLICYESLFPTRWRHGVPAIVFTNHHLFTEFKLMNWVYFGFLRHLAFLFNSETKVVSNFNPSGVLAGRSFNNDSAHESWSVLKLSFTKD